MENSLLVIFDEIPCTNIYIYNIAHGIRPNFVVALKIHK